MGTWLRRVLLGGLLITQGAVQAAEVTFDDIQPILQARCVMCHAGEAAPLGLRLTRLDELLKGSKGRPVVNAGDPAGSELVRRLKGISQPRMPMTGPPFLSDAEIALFEDWIAGGLKAGRNPPDTPVAPAPLQRPAAGQPVTYAHVAPIFASRCVKCHSAYGLMGSAPEGLLLNSYAAILDRHERVRVVPGAAGASELVRRIRGQSQPQMPYDGPPFLSDEEIQLIVDWIDQGARDTNGQPAPSPVGARVRLQGVLGEGWTLDSLPLVVGPGTRIDKAPEVGDYVEVRGRWGQDGRVLVERIRRR
ncbi:c-type cytochrome domain-containing protein [Pseudomonas sp. LFM046]|uniref:c-type cytochrome domain-containing protein n=1 Tax=Pseudomonas sp. LFM046 TaxID=1608357 RepID=UPI0005CFEBBA|nr:c-type cytochrome domain-containing protein [Pseudomonas sp. LFM046]